MIFETHINEIDLLKNKLVHDPFVANILKRVDKLVSLLKLKRQYYPIYKKMYDFLVLDSIKIDNVNNFVSNLTFSIKFTTNLEPEEVISVVTKDENYLSFENVV